MPAHSFRLLMGECSLGSKDFALFFVFCFKQCNTKEYLLCLSFGFVFFINSLNCVRLELDLGKPVEIWNTSYLLLSLSTLLLTLILCTITKNFEEKSCMESGT